MTKEMIYSIIHSLYAPNFEPNILYSLTETTDFTVFTRSIS